MLTLDKKKNQGEEKVKLHPVAEQEVLTLIIVIIITPSLVHTVCAWLIYIVLTVYVFPDLTLCTFLINSPPVTSNHLPARGFHPQKSNYIWGKHLNFHRQSPLNVANIVVRAYIVELLKVIKIPTYVLHSVQQQVLEQRGGLVSPHLDTA